MVIHRIIIETISVRNQTDRTSRPIAKEWFSNSIYKLIRLGESSRANTFSVRSFVHLNFAVVAVHKTFIHHPHNDTLAYCHAACTQAELPQAHLTPSAEGVWKRGWNVFQCYVWCLRVRVSTCELSMYWWCTAHKGKRIGNHGREIKWDEEKKANKQTNRMHIYLNELTTIIPK